MAATEIARNVGNIITFFLQGTIFYALIFGTKLLPLVAIHDIYSCLSKKNMIMNLLFFCGV
jgi:hypothetical protein